MSLNKIPPQLLLGTATAATHIEGGYQEHNWYRWSDMGMIKDGSHCKVACDHINRIEEDVQLVKDLNCDSYRLGLEWSRIEPREGQFSKEGIEIYRKELKLLKLSNITPLVTLWHFSNPLWMEDDGAWTSIKSIDRFLNFTQFVIEELGDLVEDWITLNEPNVYLTFGYFEGIWPPGKKGDIRSYFKAARNFCVAHIKAYQLIHEHYEKKNKKANVGIAHHLRLFDPYDNSRLTNLGIKLINRSFQDIFLEATTSANFLFPIKKPRSIDQGNYADFIGINYYSRDLVKGVLNPASLFGEIHLKENAPTNDLDWEIYPEGIYRIAKKIYHKYKLPIYITENGTCDEKDEFRAKFIVDHLKEINRAIADGIDIQRYYHWTLLDNFEWAEGNAARFGLYHTNYETQERTLRESGKLYARICKERRLDI